MHPDHQSIHSQWEAICERLPLKQSSHSKAMEQVFVLGVGVALRNFCHLMASSPTEAELRDSIDAWIAEMETFHVTMPITTEAL